MVSIGPINSQVSIQASGLLAGTNPLKAAARLSLADLLLVDLVLLGTQALLCHPRLLLFTDATLDLDLVRALIIGDMVARSII